MAYSTTNLYPEDLNGTNPLNLITNEIHNLQPPGPKDFYFIIPFAAPYFVDSLEVFNVATGAKYVEGVDYLVGHRFIEAMNSIGRPIAGSIRFMRLTITGQVRLKYRTIGGQWGFNDKDILAELARTNLNPLMRSWGDVGTIPYAFPPYEHDQAMDTIVGSEDLQESLERIADIMEATASGTTQSHLVDYNNPHRVNKTQIGLSNVPNFAMANDIESRDCIRADLFANPRGVLLAIQEHALKPLNAHINARGNVHGLTAADIGLGRVPNFPAATPAQAIDPTNNVTLLTPYTGALLVQKLSNDPRLDQLIIDFNNHITAYNPHGITPAMIGTLSEAEIRQLVASGGSGGGGDAATFGGLTPGQWEAKFPVNADINTMLSETADLYATFATDLVAVDLTDPVTPEMEAAYNATKISWAFGAYEAYGIYNSVNDARIVSSSKTKIGADSFPTETIANGQTRWASDKDAYYYIDGRGALHAWGTGVVRPPTKFLDASFVVGNESTGIWASKDYSWLLNSAGSLRRYNRVAAETEELPGENVIDIYVGNGMVDPRPIGLAEVGPNNQSVTIKPFGDSSWKTACALVLGGFPAGEKFHDVRIASEYVNFITYTGNAPVGGGADTRVYFLHIYKITYGSSITLTDVTSTTDIRNHTTGEVVKASTVRGITQVAGSYTHYVFTKPRPNSLFSDLLSFGSNIEGQLEMLPSSGPFLSIAAGYNFTITINQQNFVEFWGNSEDNSLFYRGGAHIPVVGQTSNNRGA